MTHTTNQGFDNLGNKVTKYKIPKFHNDTNKLDEALTLDSLELVGFRNIDSNVGQIQNNIVKICTNLEVFIYLHEYIKTLNNNALRSNFIKQGNTLLIKNTAFLQSLQKLDLKQYKDTKERAILFYLNCFVIHSKDGIKVYEYKELSTQIKGQYIYDSQIIDGYFDVKADYKQAQFYEFLNLSSNSKKHLLNFVTTIGHLLHSYKNPSIAKAIIISDINSQVTNSANGRSGKGLIIKALDEMKSLVEYNGKNLDLTKDRFVFQSIIANVTELFVLQDVEANFNFEALFAVITDKMSIEKKHQIKEILDFYLSPKIIVTTNYPIKGEGGSFTDRKHLLLLNNHFNSSFKPDHYFKNLFFLEWDKSEYSKFYALMSFCIVEYLKHGLVEYNSPELEIQKLRNETNDSFIDLMNSDYDALNNYYNLKDITNKLHAEFGSTEYSAKSRIIGKWVDLWANYKGYKVERKKSGGITKICFSLI